MTLPITSEPVESRLDVATRLAVCVAVLMTVQAGLGLVFRGQYRDVDWIRATWFGNDLVTLLVAVPLLVVGARGTAGIQASIYLIVLSVNSVLAVRSGRVESPGELPVWGTLAVLTVAATVLLVRGVPPKTATPRTV